MPERLNPTRQERIDASEVQGADAYVVIRTPLAGDMRELMLGETNPSEEEMALALLPKIVIDWNWVDEKGDPLPLPKDDPGILDQLPIEEWAFLVEHLDMLEAAPGN